ncbi:MAG: hypothetical protein EOO74_01600 [Myxococcales bacterium]|nr:MAG: hypothetical protein EOO74_01600 [Myxococcales bacterium]
MTILSTPLTEDLLDLLQRSHDRGQPALVVEPQGNNIVVTRADGSELSENEQFEVFARLAMIAAEPSRPPTSRRQGV